MLGTSEPGRSTIEGWERQVSTDNGDILWVPHPYKRTDLFRVHGLALCSCQEPPGLRVGDPEPAPYLLETQALTAQS